VVTCAYVDSTSYECRQTYNGVTTYMMCSTTATYYGSCSSDGSSYYAYFPSTGSCVECIDYK
jgi:hypothetical protein